jgi:hypothetical protein
MLKYRNFDWFLVKDRSIDRLLPVHFHVDKNQLNWLNDNRLTAMDEFYRLLGENLSEIKEKAEAMDASSQDSFNQQNFNLVIGSEIICFVYYINKNQSKGRVLIEETTKYRTISIFDFTVSAWLYPAAARNLIPIEMM